MSVETPEPIVDRTAYPSNSYKKADKGEMDDVPRVKKVVSNPVVKKKKGFFGKLKDDFTGEDAGSVGSYILFEVAIPALKNLFADAVTQGVEQLLFGNSTKRVGSSARRPGDRPGGYAGYSKMYGNQNRDEPYARSLSNRARETHAFDEIIFSTRMEAEEVRDALVYLIENYDMARVADLYTAAGLTAKFQDQKWGWYNLSDATISHIREGYLLDLPKPEHLGR